MSARSFAGYAWYETVRIMAYLHSVLLYRIRCDGQEHIPDQGPAIFISNHQSHFDPVLVGMWCQRQLHFLARSGLFKPPGLGPLIRSLGAIPVERDGLGLDGLRNTLTQLRKGEAVLIFPEATRTPDGKMQPFKPGFATLAQKSKGPVVPVGIAGAYEIWPRDQAFPTPWGLMQVVFGPPISAEECRAMSHEELAEEAERRVRACVDHAYALRKHRRRALSPFLTES